MFTLSSARSVVCALPPMSLPGCLLSRATAGVLFLAAFFPVFNVVRTSLPMNDIAEPKEEAIQRLLKVFGMDQPGKRRHHHLPPQYMLDLYNAIADDTGIARTFHPYKANIVRSFPDKDVGHQQRFFFNVTSSILHEKILEAEFHLYRTKYKSKDLNETSPLLEVRIYQVMNWNTTFTEQGNRLLDVRKISIHSSGWEVFYVKQAVVDWMKQPDKNFGLLVTVRNMFGRPTDFEMANFAKRHHSHINKKPILVIFTDDGRKKSSSSVIPSGLRHKNASRLSGENSLLLQLRDISPTQDAQDGEVRGRSRSERALGESRTGNSGCTRHELHVDFEKIGWSSWIISPKYYNAYFCKGKCEFPLGQNQWPTNHATVQSIVHELNLYPGLGTPCCVPSKLYSINLLYFDEYENVILKQYDDMVAASCGCH